MLHPPAFSSAVLAMVPALLSAGCIERDLVDPGMVVREETPRDLVAPARTDARTVHCSCDADGGLHVRAPEGSRVIVPPDATENAEADIVLPEPPRAVPLRRTKSLGFIGDNKLTPSGRDRFRGYDAYAPAHGWGYR
jgi:hypothetical protein